MAVEGEAAAPWLTGDTEVNQWLFEECDDMCRLNLSALPEPSRRSKAWATMQKHKAGKLTGSPSAYIMGILRREADGPYGRAGAAPQQQQQAAIHQPGAMQPPVAGAVQLDIQRVRNSPTPQGSFAAAAIPLPKPVPDWARAAWTVRLRVPALMRNLQRVMPKAMPQVTSLPNDVQVALCMSLLVLPEGHANPERFATMFIDAFRRMPVIAAAPSSVSSVDSNGPHRFAVVQMGCTTGYDLHGVSMALLAATDSGTPTRIVDLLCATTTSACSTASEQFVAGMSKAHTASIVQLGDAKAMLVQRVSGWASQGVKVIVLVTVPETTPPTVNHTMPGPGYHAAASRDLWTMLACLDVLVANVPQVAVVAIQPPTTTSAGDIELLNSVFGKPIGGDLYEARVPQRPFVVRAAPLLTLEAPVLRKFVLPGADCAPYDARLRGALDEAAPPPPAMPTMREAEDALDAAYAGEPLSPQQKDHLSLISRRAPDGEVGELLSRGDLAMLFGASGFLFQNYFDETQPCAQHVSPFTGQPVAAADGKPCRTGRWCPACAYFYENLVENATAWAWMRGILPAVQCLCTPTTPSVTPIRLPVLSAAIPNHSCSSSCSTDA